MMKFSLIFLLAWGSVFLGSTHTLVRIKKSEIGLKSLEELLVIRKALDHQALRLRGLEINLHHVLSKVVFLSDADVHAPRRFSARADPLFDLSQRLYKLLERLDYLESTQVLENIAKKLENLGQQCLRNTSNTPESSLNETSETRNVPKVDFDQPDKSDCFELDEDVRVDGVYRFLVPERNELHRDLHERYCAFATDGPAWTVIQNRNVSFNPPENFNRSWDEYRAGFGNLSRDFWFGNEFTHKILYRDDHELRVELQEDQEPVEWAEYPLFRLDSEAYNYQLSVEGGFRGSLPDALGKHNLMDFTTYDQRTNLGTSGDTKCAENYGGGWWLDHCSQSNLNGEHGVHQRLVPAIIWSTWRIGTDKPKSSRMMIRPVNPIPGGNFYED
ncbi:techylectin-5A [Drosophila ficusphila]|uniref:techylectin-5A n=1 Tax=Drosophila ficusphila TaxID=30025 RepID=UPI0007E71118|nr:techylectin-5A [Drosophila ficusphila]